MESKRMLEATVNNLKASYESEIDDMKDKMK